MATENEIRAQVVRFALEWLGYSEADGRHKKIIDFYNAISPLPRGYRVTYSDAWCAAFVSAVAARAGLLDVMPAECGCWNMVELYKAHKDSRWEEDDAYAPSPGDVIMYDWQDVASGWESNDNRGVPDHVGIVEKVEGRVITVIEGNYSKSVKRRNLAVNGRYIRGYCLPAYHLKADSAARQPETKPQQPSAPMANDEAIWRILKSKGLSDEAVAGIMGNLDAESGLNPRNLENWMNTHLGITDVEFTRRVDEGVYSREWFINKNGESGRGSNGGWGYGLAQWTWHSRKQQLYDFARARGASIGDLGMQIDFLWDELQEFFPGVMRTLKAASTVREASDAVLLEYENPNDKSESAKARRAALGQKYYDKFVGMPVGVPEKETEDMEEMKDMTQDEFYTKYFLPAIDRFNAEAAKLDPADWSEEAREWAENSGLIRGVGADADGSPTYQYKTYLTREMAVTLLHRFIGMLGCPSVEEADLIGLLSGPGGEEADEEAGGAS